MAKLRSMLARVAAMFHRRELDERVDEELAFHIEMQTEENIRQGMSPGEARRCARIECGGVEQTKEMHRDVRGLPFVENLFQDVRFAFRSFRRDLGFTVTVLTTLALGIGVGTAIFAVVNAILLRPLPYKDPDRLVYLTRSSIRGGVKTQSYWYKGVSYGDCEEWRNDSGLFDSLSCLDADGATLKDITMFGISVDVGFCETVGVRPLLGRCFEPDEYRRYFRGDARPVILQHAFWKDEFGGDPKVIGRTFKDGFPFRVIGVMPPEFVFQSRRFMWLMPLWIPLIFHDNPHEYFGRSAIGRLKPGVSLEEAQAGAEVFSQRMAEMHPDTHEGWHYSLSPVAEEAAGGLRGPLRLLLAAVGLMLSIVCLNVAGLVVVRSMGRSSEIAVRSAIGAGRSRLIRQLLTESLLLAVAGGALALAVAWPFVEYLRLWIPSTQWAAGLLRPNLIRMDPWVLAFAVAVALGSSVLFGLLPALRGTSIHLANWINEGARGLASGDRQRRGGHWLSVAQVTMAVLLTVGSCLLLRSFLNLHQQGAGFRPDNVIALPIQLGKGRPKTQVEQALIYERLRDELAAIPGVDAVSIGDFGLSPNGGAVDGYRIGKGEAFAAVTYTAFGKSADAGFFQMLGIPLLEGRVFDEGDRADGTPVAIVSQEAAKQFWPGEDPIGKKLYLASDGKAEEPGMTVVGVVGDVREGGLAADPQPAVYQPTIQWGGWGRTFLIKTTRDPGPLYSEIVARSREVFLGVLPSPQDYQRLDKLVRDSTWQLNYAALILTGLAGLALVVSAVGVYGVLSYTVHQRTREIGLRMAVGAAPSEVLRMVLRQGISIAATGIVTGVIAAAGLTRFLGSLLYGVEPLDGSTFALVAVVMLAVASLASYVPARRAAKLDPTAALRCD